MYTGLKVDNIFTSEAWQQFDSVEQNLLYITLLTNNVERGVWSGSTLFATHPAIFRHFNGL